MSRYDKPEYADEPAEDVDPRIVAMHRVVDLERQHERAQREAEERAKMAAIVRDELREAREELHERLGLPSSNQKAVSIGTVGIAMNR